MRRRLGVVLPLLACFASQGCATYWVESLGSRWDRDNEEAVRSATTIEAPERPIRIEIRHSEGTDDGRDEGEVFVEGQGAWRLHRASAERSLVIRRAAAESGALEPGDDVVLTDQASSGAPVAAVLVASSCDGERLFVVETTHGWRRVAAQLFEQHHHDTLESIAIALALVPPGLLAFAFDVATFPISLPILFGVLES
jgi:hypothetical protein